MALMWCFFAIRSPCYFAELQSRDERRLYRRGTSGELEASSPPFGAVAARRRALCRREPFLTRSASYWEWIPLTSSACSPRSGGSGREPRHREGRSLPATRRRSGSDSRGVRAERLLAVHVNVSLERSLHDRGVGARRRGDQHCIRALLVGQPPVVG